MAIERGIFLHEALLLLALNEERGTPGLAVPTGTALGAGIMGELLLRDRIATEQTRFSTVVVVRSAQQVGDPVIDQALERIRSAKRRASMPTWIGRIGNTRGLLHDVARRLCAKGVLRVDEKQVLLLFRRRIYPEVDPVPERKVIERLRAVAFEHAAPDAPTLMALGIARHTSLLHVVLSRSERKDAKKRIAARVAESPQAKLIDDAVRYVVQSSAAVMAS